MLLSFRSVIFLFMFSRATGQTCDGCQDSVGEISKSDWRDNENSGCGDYNAEKCSSQGDDTPEEGKPNVKCCICNGGDRSSCSSSEGSSEESSSKATCDSYSGCAHATLNLGSGGSCSGAAASSCDAATCCWAKATCASFSSCSDSSVNKGNGVSCSGAAATCDSATCCSAKATCASFSSCSVSLVNKGSSVFCSGVASTCDTSTCCSTKATCASFSSCSSSTFNKGSGTSCAGVASSTCNTGTCCSSLAKCNSYSGCADSTLNKGSSVSCSGAASTCDTSTCCNAKATCASFSCPSSMVNKGSEISCAGVSSTCDTPRCCNADGKATCDNYQGCTSSILNKGSGVSCSGAASSCDASTCCNIPASCEQVLCSAGTMNQGSSVNCGAGTSSCDTNTCCEPLTCNTFCCGVTKYNLGFQKNCASTGCDDATCCGTMASIKTCSSYTGGCDIKKCAPLQTTGCDTIRDNKKLPDTTPCDPCDINTCCDDSASVTLGCEVVANDDKDAQWQNFQSSDSATYQKIYCGQGCKIGAGLCRLKPTGLNTESWTGYTSRHCSNFLPNGEVDLCGESAIHTRTSGKCCRCEVGKFSEGAVGGIFSKVGPCYDCPAGFVQEFAGKFTPDGSIEEDPGRAYCKS